MNAQGRAGQQRHRSAKTLNRRAQGQEPHQQTSARGASQANRKIPRHADARRVAYEALLRIDEQHSFSNLLVPKLCAYAQLSTADSALVTDIVYGVLRWRGLIRPIIAAAAHRALGDIDAMIVPILELGAYQALWMEIAPHAVGASTVALAKSLYGKGRAGFVNAVMHQIIAKPLQTWQSMIVSRIDSHDQFERLAVRFSHPKWIVEALYQAWLHAGYDEESDAMTALPSMLEEDNQPAMVTLARHGQAITQEDLRAQLPRRAVVQEGLLSPYALRVSGVNPAQIPAIQHKLVGVEDEGSQCAALALAHASVDGQASDYEQQSLANMPVSARAHWLDMCAGPGGKTALIASLAAERNIVVSANEPSAHRANLVRSNIEGLPLEAVDTVYEYDGRYFGEHMREQFTRVLVDAPCSGLGALRRRPEARWRKKPEDIDDLTQLQAQLLRSGIDATMSGGVIAYVTCSPVVEETVQIVDDVLADPQYAQCVERLDTTAVLRSVCKPMPLPHRAGDVTLFEHLHHSDQMFISLLRKR